MPVEVTDGLMGLKPEGAEGRPRVRVPSRQAARGPGARMLYKAAHEAGVQLSPHWFRHAHATHALNHGAPIHVVSQSLGHANVATTSKYLHVNPTVGSSQWLPAV